MPVHRLDSREIAEIIGNWFQETRGVAVVLVDPHITLAITPDGKVLAHNQAVDVHYADDPPSRPYTVGESVYTRDQVDLEVKKI